MTNEIIGQKLRYMSQSKFETITEADDELYAVSASGIGFPSSRYEDLILGVSGTPYTAPANGWFMIAAKGWTAMDMYNISAGYMGSVFAVRSGDGYARSTVAAKKGQDIGVEYAGTPINTLFRFIYAEGE